MPVAGAIHRRDEQEQHVAVEHVQLGHPAARALLRDHRTHA